MKLKPFVPSAQADRPWIEASFTPSCRMHVSGLGYFWRCHFQVIGHPGRMFWCHSKHVLVNGVITSVEKASFHVE